MPMVDFGIAVLRDPRTNDVYVDEDGNLITITKEELFQQECKVAKQTMRGEEPLDILYGFPLSTVIRNEYGLDRFTLFNTAIISTLNMKRINMLLESRLLNLEYSEDEGLVKLDIEITSINGNDSRIAMEVELPFQS